MCFELTGDLVGNRSKRFLFGNDGR